MVSSASSTSSLGILTSRLSVDSFATDTLSESRRRWKPAASPVRVPHCNGAVIRTSTYKPANLVNTLIKITQLDSFTCGPGGIFVVTVLD